MRLTFTVATKNNMYGTVQTLVALVCAVLLAGCTHLLYPADRRPFVIQEKIRPIPKDIRIPMGNENSFLHAWHFSAQTKSKGLVIHFHGNGQNLTTHFLFFKWLADHGYDYLIFDYRGYGESSDKEATQAKTVEDGQAVFKYAYDNFPGLKVIAIGQSLGSNVLVRTLQELNEKELSMYLPKLVVLDSSFLSYQQAARSVLSQRWFLYLLKPFTYFAISDQWSAKNKRAQTPNIPALFFHGTDDPLVSYELGKKNFDLWPGPKVFLTQPGGSHTSAFGNPRFQQSRLVMLKCMDHALNGILPFEACEKMEISRVRGKPKGNLGFSKKGCN